MIAALALVGVVLPRLVVVEEPAAQQVIVQAWVPAEADDAGPEWALLGRCLLDGTKSHTRAELMAFGSQAGTSPQVSILPDLIRVEVAAPAKGLGVAMSLLASVVREPLLDAEDVRARRGGARGEPWSAALWPAGASATDASIRTLREIHGRSFRPERIVVAVGGAVTKDEASRTLEEAFGDWRPSRFPAPLRRSGGPEMSKSSGVVEWHGPPSRLSKEDAAVYLASVALGAGKGGALHRVLRERHGLTYRQEALWWPTRTGWRLRILVARQGDWPEGFEARAALLEDVAKWDEAVLARALGAGSGGLTGTFLPGPIWIDGSGPIGPGLSDRLALAGYRALVGGDPMDAADLATVDLAALRAAGSRLVGP